jgi:hypothetical protein
MASKIQAAHNSVRQYASSLRFRTSNKNISSFSLALFMPLLFTLKVRDNEAWFLWATCLPPPPGGRLVVSQMAMRMTTSRGTKHSDQCVHLETSDLYKDL